MYAPEYYTSENNNNDHHITLDAGWLWAVNGVRVWSAALCCCHHRNHRLPRHMRTIMLIVAGICGVEHQRYRSTIWLHVVCLFSH